MVSRGTPFGGMRRKSLDRVKKSKISQNILFKYSNMNLNIYSFYAYILSGQRGEITELRVQIFLLVQILNLNI